MTSEVKSNTCCTVHFDVEQPVHRPFPGPAQHRCCRLCLAFLFFRVLLKKWTKLIYLNFRAQNSVFLVVKLFSSLLIGSDFPLFIFSPLFVGSYFFPISYFYTPFYWVRFVLQFIFLPLFVGSYFFPILFFYPFLLGQMFAVFFTPFCWAK